MESRETPHSPSFNSDASLEVGGGGVCALLQGSGLCIGSRCKPFTRELNSTSQTLQQLEDPIRKPQVGDAPEQFRSRYV